jgi:hypothetical protein
VPACRRVHLDHEVDLVPVLFAPIGEPGVGHVYLENGGEVLRDAGLEQRSPEHVVPPRFERRDAGELGRQPAVGEMELRRLYQPRTAVPQERWEAADEERRLQ